MSPATAPLDFTLATTVSPAQYPALASLTVRAFEHTRYRQVTLPSGPAAPSFKDLVDHNVYNLRIAALIPDPSPINVIALDASGTILGYAQWLAPVDRSSTLGSPLPDEEKRGQALEEMSKRLREAEGEEGDSWRAGYRAAERVVGAMDAKVLAEYGPQMEVGLKEWARGRRCWMLQAIAVDPNCRNRGIGSALLDWGLAQAEKTAVPVWVDASSPEAVSLCDSRGFKAVHWTELTDKHGPGGVLRWPGMGLGEFEA